MNCTLQSEVYISFAPGERLLPTSNVHKPLHELDTPLTDEHDHIEGTTPSHPTNTRKSDSKHSIGEDIKEMFGMGHGKNMDGMPEREQGHKGHEVEVTTAVNEDNHLEKADKHSFMTDIKGMFGNGHHGNKEEVTDQKPFQVDGTDHPNTRVGGITDTVVDNPIQQDNNNAPIPPLARTQSRPDLQLRRVTSIQAASESFPKFQYPTFIDLAPVTHIAVPLSAINPSYGIKLHGDKHGEMVTVPVVGHFAAMVGNEK